jgi:hypothetical protein
MCPPKNGWWIIILKGNGGWKKGKRVDHKRTKQKEKIETIGLLLCKVFKKWLFKRWCWKQMWCRPITPLNQDGCLMQFGHHEPHCLTPSPNYHFKLMKQQVSKKKCHEIANIKLCSPINIRIPPPWSVEASRRFSQNQKHGKTKRPNNGPWDTTCNDMGIHLEKFHETTS